MAKMWHRKREQNRSLIAWAQFIIISRITAEMVMIGEKSSNKSRNEKKNEEMLRTAKKMNSMREKLAYAFTYIQMWMPRGYHFDDNQVILYHHVFRK